jgi:hypothetical protein
MIAINVAVVSDKYYRESLFFSKLSLVKLFVILVSSKV